MSFRFRRMLQVPPGVRIKLNRSGVSPSVGPTGRSVTLGGRGAYLNIAMPSTGLSYRKRITVGLDSGPQGDTAERRGKGARKLLYPKKVEVALNADLKLRVANAETGRVLPSEAQRAFLKHHEKEIGAFLDETAQRLSQEIEGIGNVHLSSMVCDPAAAARAMHLPDLPKRPDAPVFSPPPDLPQQFSRGRLVATGASRRHYRQKLGAWLMGWKRTILSVEKNWAPYSDAHITALRARADIRARMVLDPNCFAEVLTVRLEGIPWPRETLIECEIGDDPETVLLYVDLSEVEDLPTKSVERAPDALKLRHTELKGAQRVKIYRRYVISTGAALIRVVFETAPHVQKIQLTGFTLKTVDRKGVVDRVVLRIKIDRDTYNLEAAALFCQADILEMASRDWCRADEA